MEQLQKSVRGPTVTVTRRIKVTQIDLYTFSIRLLIVRGNLLLGSIVVPSSFIHVVYYQQDRRKLTLVSKYSVLLFPTELCQVAGHNAAPRFTRQRELVIISFTMRCDSPSTTEQVARHSSCDRKLLRVPRQPPYVKGTHIPLAAAKAQRRYTPRQGPCCGSSMQIPAGSWVALEEGCGYKPMKKESCSFDREVNEIIILRAF